MKPANLIDGASLIKRPNLSVSDRDMRTWLAQTRNWAVVMKPRKTYWMKLGSAPNKDELRIARGIANG